MANLDPGVQGGLTRNRQEVNVGQNGTTKGAETSDGVVSPETELEPDVEGANPVDVGNGATSSRICLNQASMVDLTPTSHRPRTHTSSQEQNSSLNQLDKDKFFAICPFPTDEPPIVTKLAGHSVSVFCEMSGWSFMHPLKFYNINLTTHFKNFGTGTEDLLEKCIPLREMETMIGCHGTTRAPVYVQVVAKRKVDVIVASNGRINIIPLIVIADKSGYCVLCSFNEGLATVYNAVDVGDLLLLKSCIPQRPYRTYHKGLFADKTFINMELKVQWHSVLSHYIRKFSSLNISPFRMPPVLFGDLCPLFTPTDAYQSFEKPRQKFGQKPPELYYDVVGVVSYVGRIERFRYNHDRTSSTEQLIDGRVERRPFTPFFLFRWVHIVDKTSKPLPIKLYVNNLTTADQESLVPGTIVIISHCQTEDVTYSTKYTKTSPFTQIYVGGSVEKYFMLHPQQFKEKTGKLLIRENFAQVVARQDVTWSVGGTLASKIVDKEKFFEYMSLKQGPPSEIGSLIPLARRESRRVIAKGVIWKVLEVPNENVAKVMYVHENNSRSFHVRKTAHWLSNFPPYECFSFCSWYSFTRKLPPFHPSLFLEVRSRDMVKKLQVAHRDFCKQLLLPSQSDDPKVLPPAARLEKVDGPPYFLIDVVNEDSRKCYTCIWKSTEYTSQQMRQKIIDARNKTIFCLIDVFCVEPEKPLEVNLHDFVTED